MNNMDILVSDKEKIKVAGRIYEIGELSLIQIIKLSKFVAKVIFSSKEKLDKLKKETESSDDNMADALVIMDMIDEEKIPELFGIILNEKDTDFLTANLATAETLEIVAIVCEKNDFSQLKKNVERVTKAIKMD